MNGRSVLFVLVLAVILPACVCGSNKSKATANNVEKDMSLDMSDMKIYLEKIMEMLEQTMQMMENTMQMQEKMGHDVADLKKQMEKKIANDVADVKKLKKEKVCPIGFTGQMSIGSCHRLVRAHLNWDDAQKNCRNLNNRAHLVVIDNADEMEILKSLLKEDAASPRTPVWTAGQRMNVKTSSEFVWKPNVDVGGANVKMLYTNWRPGQPDNSGNSWRCLAIDPGMKWSNLNCVEDVYSVCEIELNA